MGFELFFYAQLICIIALFATAIICMVFHGEHESHVAFLDEISDVDICPVHLFCHGEDCR